MEAMGNTTQYYAKKSPRESGYDWMVRIDDRGCFITDPINDWEKDEDYRDEALSKYEKMESAKACEILQEWGRLP